MPTAPRKPLLVNVSWATALIVMLAVGYVLSYAPVYRHWYYKSWRDSPWHRPVRILIDRTALREPLLSWAGLWGVERDMRVRCLLRTGDHSVAQP